MIFHIADRRGNLIGEITDRDIRTARQTEEVNGQDIIEITCETILQPDYRLIWRDDMQYRGGMWHEHVVKAVETVHDETGDIFVTATAKNSLCDLDGYYITNIKPAGKRDAVLGRIISGTPWKSSGVVEDYDDVSFSFYHISAAAALAEFEKDDFRVRKTYVWVSDGKINGRSLAYTMQAGTATAPAGQTIRFEYGHNMANSRRYADPDNICTALYGWGKGEAVGDGNGRKLSFDNLNGGLAYVCDEEARKLYGRIDGGHFFSDANFPDCDSAEELISLTRAELAKLSHPAVSYEANVQLLDYGEFVDSLSVGDVVQVVDKDFPGELREVMPVSKADWDLLVPQKSTVYLGGSQQDLAVYLKSQASGIKTINRRF